MFCPKCGNRNDAAVGFCRRCGAELKASSLAPAKQNLPSVRDAAESKDPDELTGNGIGRVIVGDGFFIVALILSATDSAVSSLLWLFLLIPAFYCFGKGAADILHARQIRRRRRGELQDAPNAAALPPPRESFVDLLRRTASGELAAAPSVTERTTRDLP